MEVSGGHFLKAGRNDGRCWGCRLPGSIGVKVMAEAGWLLGHAGQRGHNYHMDTRLAGFLEDRPCNVTES